MNLTKEQIKQIEELFNMNHDYGLMFKCKNHNYEWKLQIDPAGVYYKYRPLGIIGLDEEGFEELHKWRTAGFSNKQLLMLGKILEDKNENNLTTEELAIIKVLCGGFYSNEINKYFTRNKQGDVVLRRDIEINIIDKIDNILLEGNNE